MKDLLNRLLNHPLATRTNAIALAIAGAILLLIALLFKKTQTMNTKIKGNAPAGLARVVKQYGVEFARTIERMARKETANFTSGQWLGTGTAGMEAVKGQTQFPFGWDSLATFAKAKGLSAADFFLHQFRDNHDGRTPYFVGFRDTGVFIDFMAWNIKVIKKGDYLAWYRRNTPEYAADRARYNASLPKFSTEFVNKIVGA